MKRLITTMLIAITIFTLCSGIGAAAEHTVQPSGSIQEAVNDAVSGDIIIVKPGTYSGSVTIDKENLTIRSESGNPEDTIIKANKGDTKLFSVNANNTTISGFKVTADGDSSVIGIRLYRCSNCTITDNKADSNKYGIHLYISTWNTIFNNTADLNQHGIVLEGECSNNNLTSNRVNSNTDYGFYLSTFSSSNSLNNNTAQYNNFGFYLTNSTLNIISNNDVSNNTGYGMWISHSNNNTISGNTANETNHGISLDSSDGNIVSGNVISLNDISGLYMCRGSDNNTVFNNYLNNTLNADISNYNNTWNTTKTLGKNIIGGPYIAGNFWAKPDGTGFSESAIDTDLDGIADSQYAGTNFTDYLPLVLTSTPEPVLPVANFSSNVTEGSAPLDVQFTDLSQNATKWSWDFGDGASSTAQNATHTYSIAGSYDVNLTVSNDNGTDFKLATITVYEKVYPIASFSSNVSEGYAPLDVQFNDSSLNATSVSWDFENDGKIDSTDRTPLHTYFAVGNYTVNLTASNLNGTDSKLSNINVSEEPILPVANFSSNVSSGYAPLFVQFNDSSENATKWSWDFGDGNNSTVQNPINIYSKAGNYTVNLTVSNVNGTSSTFGTINVSEPEPIPVLPVANFSTSVTDGYVPLSVTFTDLSQNATSISWDVNGDGIEDSMASSFTYTYVSAGTYTAKLTAINLNGTNSSFGTITVKPQPVLPVANFSSNVSSGYAPLDVQFNDSSENATSLYWDFGDGYNSTGQNPVHTFSAVGTYPVNLTAKNDNGTNSSYGTITVSAKPEPVLPVANFTSNVTSGYAPLDVQFTDLSQNATKWSWDFGDGASSTAQNATHTYSTIGIYDVNLTISNDNGTDFKLATITVYEKVYPIASFSSNVSEGYAPLDVQFFDSSENATGWNWDFGDGNNSTVKNPINTYSKAGSYIVNLTVSNANGTNSTSGTINVSELDPISVLPVANFSSNTTEGYAPLDVQFNDSSLNATSVSWDFENDGKIDSTDRTPLHTYSAVGNYTVNLTASNLNGTDSKLSNITVSEEPVLPVANFSSNVSSGYAPLDVQFNDSSENATSLYWDFGDGYNSTEPNPLHTYSAVGTYPVNLTAINGNGTNSSYGTITVLSTPDPILPVANFTSNVSKGIAPLDVQFFDSSENATGWNWDFGDGNNSTAKNPINTYSKAGSYIVNLTVSNANGTNSTSGTINVSKPEPIPILPMANFTSNVTSGFAPLSVQFNDSSLNTISLYWDFGDSTNSTEQNPLHTYSAVGTYTVNLTAINVNGTNSSFGTITVTAKPELVLPVANFSSNETEGYAPLSVQFNDSSENATGWNWDFGDGSNSTEQNPLHTYSSAGNFDVNLTVSNGNGSDSKLATITVYEKVYPVANFSSNVSSGYAPLSVQFTDSSENAIRWNWDFNDGSSSTDQNPTHTYFKSGTYTVNLTAINGNGTDSKLATIYVLVKPASVLPVADFSSNTTEGYAPLSVQFNDSSKNATSVSWDFENDGKIDSTDRNPIHTYSSVGTYPVNLTAINLNGTSFKLSTITVLAKPEPVLPLANFSSNVSGGYAPLSVQFNDSSLNATSLYWNFGDGNNSTEPNPLHTYSSVGTYTVNLTASNINGTNSSFGTITVSAKPESVLPIANFRTSVTGGYAPLSVTFTDLSENATSISWDVNGDGIEDSKASSFTYQYASAGTYTAKLIAKNENGTNEKTATVIVDKKSSGGSSGGSGGGGGGGSPEPAKNVEVKELSQVFITNGNHIKFNFPKNATAVVYLSFDARKTAGKTTTIVEMLKNQSTLTPDAPQGEVYSYLNIWVGNGGYATEKNIENATVCFRVKKSWIENKDIDWSSIILNRYSDRKWNELSTTLLREDERYLYFVSETPGFSPFAITAKKTVIETLPETESSEQNGDEQNGDIELDIEKNVEQVENTGVSQNENLSNLGSGIMYFIIGMLGVFLLGGFLYRRK